MVVAGLVVAVAVQARERAGAASWLLACLLAGRLHSGWRGKCGKVKFARDVADHKEVVAVPMSVSSRSWAGTHWRAARGQVGLRASR